MQNVEFTLDNVNFKFSADVWHIENFQLHSTNKKNQGDKTKPMEMTQRKKTYFLATYKSSRLKKNAGSIIYAHYFLMNFTQLRNRGEYRRYRIQLALENAFFQ